MHRSPNTVHERETIGCLGCVVVRASDLRSTVINSHQVPSMRRVQSFTDNVPRSVVENGGVRDGNWNDEVVRENHSIRGGKR